MVPLFVRQYFRTCKISKTRKSRDEPVKQFHLVPGIEDFGKAPVDEEEEECHGDEDDGKVIDNVVDGGL